MAVSLRVPEEVKKRIDELARQQDVTPHGFMLEAIREKVEAEEARLAFHAEAERRLARMKRPVSSSRRRRCLNTCGGALSGARPHLRSRARRGDRLRQWSAGRSQTYLRVLCPGTIPELPRCGDCAGG